jgi:hypothetical protein
VRRRHRGVLRVPGRRPDRPPDEVRDDWETLNGGITELRDGLAAAGVDIDDLEQALESGQLPEGVDRAEMLELGAAMQGFAGDMRDAFEAIEQHASCTRFSPGARARRSRGDISWPCRLSLPNSDKPRSRRQPRPVGNERR